MNTSKYHTNVRKGIKRHRTCRESRAVGVHHDAGGFATLA